MNRIITIIMVLISIRMESHLAQNGILSSQLDDEGYIALSLPYLAALARFRVN